MLIFLNFGLLIYNSCLQFNVILSTTKRFCIVPEISFLHILFWPPLPCHWVWFAICLKGIFLISEKGPVYASIKNNLVIKDKFAIACWSLIRTLNCWFLKITTMLNNYYEAYISHNFTRGWKKFSLEFRFQSYGCVLKRFKFELDF